MTDTYNEASVISIFRGTSVYNYNSNYNSNYNYNYNPIYSSIYFLSITYSVLVFPRNRRFGAVLAGCL